jgi:hypothetical protein
MELQGDATIGILPPNVPVLFFRLHPLHLVASRSKRGFLKGFVNTY